MHSGSTTSSAPWRTASFTRSVASAMLCSISPSRASVWAAAARKRFLVKTSSLSGGGVGRSGGDLAAEHGETAALELDETGVGDGLGVARPRQVDGDEIGHARRPAGQPQQAVGGLHGPLEGAGAERRG